MSSPFLLQLFYYLGDIFVWRLDCHWSCEDALAEDFVFMMRYHFNPADLNPPLYEESFDTEYVIWDQKLANRLHRG